MNRKEVSVLCANKVCQTAVIAATNERSTSLAGPHRIAQCVWHSHIDKGQQDKATKDSCLPTKKPLGVPWESFLMFLGVKGHWNTRWAKLRRHASRSGIWLTLRDDRWWRVEQSFGSVLAPYRTVWKIAGVEEEYADVMKIYVWWINGRAFWPFRFWWWWWSRSLKEGAARVSATSIRDGTTVRTIQYISTYHILCHFRWRHIRFYVSGPNRYFSFMWHILWIQLYSCTTLP